MKKRYIREVNKTYLVLEKPQEASRFALRMMEENHFRYLLQGQKRILDGVENIYYDTTAMYSLRDLCTSMELTPDLLDALLEQLYRAGEELEAYLLDASGIRLCPEEIFYCLREKEYRFLYRPGEGKEEENEDLKALAEFLVQRIDHRYAEGVEKAYEIYEEVWTKAADREALLAIAERSRQESKQSFEEERKRQSEHINGSGRAEEEFTEREDPLSQQSGANGSAISASETASDGIFPETELVEEKGIPYYYKKYGWALFALIGIAIYGSVRFLFSLSVAEQILLPAFLVAVMGGLYFLGYYQMNKKAQEEAQKAMEQEKLRLARLAYQEEEQERAEYEEEEEQTVFLGLNKEKRYYLVDRQDPEKERIRLTRFPFQIGKNAGISDLVLSDPAVSSLHARFEKNEEGDITLTDLGSLNQTYVNGVPLEPHAEHVLDLADEIQIGQTTYLFRASFA